MDMPTFSFKRKRDILSRTIPASNQLCCSLNQSICPKKYHCFINNQDQCVSLPRSSRTNIKKKKKAKAKPNVACPCVWKQSKSQPYFVRSSRTIVVPSFKTSTDSSNLYPPHLGKSTVHTYQYITAKMILHEYISEDDSITSRG